DGRDVAYTSSSPLQGTQTQLIPAYLQLEVKPSIFADGRIRMEVTVSDDEPVPAINPSATQPDIYRRKANTFMIVRDGETAVIGGIVRESNTRFRQGFPGLMNIPLLSYLFGNKSQQKDLNELLVFITPTIIKRPPPAS
ncbi:MAG: type II and III secretion system protein, partial [Desulfomonilaceae bacterium]